MIISFNPIEGFSLKLKSLTCIFFFGEIFLRILPLGSQFSHTFFLKVKIFAFFLHLLCSPLYKSAEKSHERISIIDSETGISLLK